MVTDDEERAMYASRKELLAAATENALITLALDSVEVALVAVEQLGGVSVPGDLHAHIGSLASDEFEDEEARIDLRPAVLGAGLGYDDVSLRRHNELLETMSPGVDIDWPAVRPIVERGKDMLRRAISSLEEAGRL